MGWRRRGPGAAQSALTLKPGFTDAYNNMASALVQKGCIPQAMDCYAAALRIDPNVASPAAPHQSHDTLRTAASRSWEILCFRCFGIVRPRRTFDPTEEDKLLGCLPIVQSVATQLTFQVVQVFMQTGCTLWSDGERKHPTESTKQWWGAWLDPGDQPASREKASGHPHPETHWYYRRESG